MNSWQARDSHVKGVQRKYLQHREANGYMSNFEVKAQRTELSQLSFHESLCQYQEHRHHEENIIYHNNSVTPEDGKNDFNVKPFETNQSRLDEAFCLYTPDNFIENEKTLQADVPQIPQHLLGSALTQPLGSHFSTTDSENEHDHLIETEKAKALLENERHQMDFTKNLTKSDILLHRTKDSNDDLRFEVKIEKWKRQNIHKISLDTYFILLYNFDDDYTPSMFCNHSFSLTGIDKNIACEIMSHCDIRTMLRLSQTNRWWYNLSHENVLYWKKKWNELVEFFELSFRYLKDKTPTWYNFGVVPDRDEDVRVFRESLLVTPESDSLMRSQLTNVYQQVRSQRNAKLVPKVTLNQYPKFE